MKSQTAECPGGKARLVVKVLKDQYEKKDTAALVQCKKALSKIQMKKDEDPCMLFQQIAQVENQFWHMATPLDCLDKIAVVINKAPKEYQLTITAEQHLHGASVIIDNFEEAMDALYHNLYRKDQGVGSKQGNDNDKSELALSAFDGNCFKCRKKGHKEADCRSKVKSKGSSTNKKCQCCGKRGHLDCDCWDNLENANKQPALYKPKVETGHVGTYVGGTSTEFLLTGLDIEGSLGKKCCKCVCRHKEGTVTRPTCQ